LAPSWHLGKKLHSEYINSVHVHAAENHYKRFFNISSRQVAVNKVLLEIDSRTGLTFQEKSLLKRPQ
jgi:hypothetical protein